MSAWELVVLGVAQDGGMPHPGCHCDRCGPAFRGERPPARVACLGLTDGERGFLFDATPDLPSQLHDLGVVQPHGVFLTHAHMGHVTGLLYLGREALGTRGTPLFATERMHAFVRDNVPYADLVTQSRITPFPNDDVDLGGVRVRAIPVPHRDEHGDTVAYEITGPTRRALYLPDIDAWDAWDRNIRDVVSAVDVAFLDATFLDASEFPYRDPKEIPHPFVSDTMERLDGLGDRVQLIHLNHTNTLFDDPTPATSRGFHVATDGARFVL